MAHSDAEEVHDSSSDSDVEELISSPPKTKKRKAAHKISEPAPKEKFSAEELTWDTLRPYKKHPFGEKKFNQLAKTSPYTPNLFVSTLKKVMDDPNVDPPQSDPLKIVEAMEQWNSIQPEVFGSKKNLTPEQRRARDIVGQKFHSYLQLLRSTDPIKIPVRVFCHMVCQNGCPPEFDGYNDRSFRESNTQELEAKLEGRHSDTWNNLQNASMHLMVKWTDEELKDMIAPHIKAEEWVDFNPKQIGVLLQQWLNNLDTEELEAKQELKQAFIPTAGDETKCCTIFPKEKHTDICIGFHLY